MPYVLLTTYLCSAAASGWAGWALAHPEFGTSVNPNTTRGADYAHHITASPPEFEIPAASLLCTVTFGLILLAEMPLGFQIRVG